MLYKDWLKSITNQITQFAWNKETNLVLLRNHLKMLISDIENNPKFKEQLSECED